ncbi:MAG: hypothetical protein NW223_15305 [Hyphomicrobiaceae bacterium]|nr:hypothetical protein [Hyphomicrobiaceae bacterium]
MPSSRLQTNRRAGRRAAHAAAMTFALLAATAQPAEAGSDRPPASLTAISPIFGQLVAFSQPLGFVVAFEQPTADQYIREAVLKGETIDDWSQMITVTGAKGLAADASVTPKALATGLAAGFRNACPDTHLAQPLGSLEIDGHDAFAVLAGCGTVDSSADGHSELALIIAIRGAADYYTIQWAERDEGSDDIPAIDETKWTERLEALNPIRLCPIVEGEKAPYPSCVDR